MWLIIVVSLILSILTVFLAYDENYEYATVLAAVVTGLFWYQGWIVLAVTTAFITGALWKDFIDNK